MAQSDRKLVPLPWENPDKFMRLRDDWTKVLSESSTKFSLQPTNFKLDPKAIQSYDTLEDAKKANVTAHTVAHHYLKNHTKIQGWLDGIRSATGDKEINVFHL